MAPIVGHSATRLDAWAKVTGAGIYVDSIRLPGMLHAAVVRSPLPHARIRSIRTTAAERMPAVRAVLTAADLPPDGPVRPTYGAVYKDQGIVAQGIVRFVGEPVAAVAAETLEAARLAADAIEVDYEPLPGLFDPEAAAQPGAPLLHPELAMPGEGMADVLKLLRPVPGTNIYNAVRLRRGNVDAVWDECDAVVSGTYRCPTAQHVPLETHMAVASFDSSGALTVWSSTQTPYLVRNELAEIFRLPLHHVRVIVPSVGGGFGAKAYCRLEPLVSALARKARRPVRLLLTREEEFVTLVRHALVIHLTTGARRDGTLVARKAELFWDGGAYADIGPRLRAATVKSVGPYKMAHAQVDGYCVYTNHPPGGAFRGFGTCQVVWASEAQMDEMATALDMDPVAFRQRNLLGDEDSFVTGERMQGVAFQEALAEAARLIGPAPAPTQPDRPRRVRGIGFAVNAETTITPSSSSAQVRLNEDGTLTLYTSTVEMGQGAHTVLAQMAAETMGISLEAVRVVGPDTDVTPYDLSTTASRSTFHMGHAVRSATEDARRQLLEIASDHLEAAPADLEVTHGEVRVRGMPGRALTIAAVLGLPAAIRHGTVIGRGSFATEARGLDPETGQGQMSAFWGACAGAAEVEVDLETGCVEVLRYISVAHAGNAINPELCHGQSQGSVVMGLGHALMEELQLVGGQPVNGSLLSYHVPSMVDLPGELRCERVEKAYGPGPFGAKGIGEADIAPVSGAIGNAIYQATGVRLRALPYTADRVLAGLNEARNQSKRAGG